MNVEETVRQIVEPLLKEKDIELIKVDFLKVKGKYRLILTVDKYKESIKLNELAEANKLVNETIEEKGILKKEYDLELSSPGAERPLMKIGDYKRFEGKKAKVVLYEPAGNQVSLKGTIKGIKDKKVIFNIDDRLIMIDFENIKSGNLFYEIKEDLK